MKILRLFATTLLALATLQQLWAQDPPLPEATEPTLPPVVVEAGDDMNFVDDFSNQVFYGNGGSIPWNAPASSFGQRVGSYNQPAWTAQRPFAGTRTYVLP